ncbi:MAG: M15 family metallopeptidase [Methylosarcina sp.]
MKKFLTMRQLGFAISLLFLLFEARVNSAALPADFVYLTDVAPSIVLDIRYANGDNFVGGPIDGYARPIAITTRAAAEALKKAQADLQRFGLGLKVFDAYRPQKAVDHFVRWARDGADLRTRPRYYPGVAKQDLFREEYIAARSGHSRGSTVDVTLVYRDDGGLAIELDMGSPFDFFDSRSWPEYPALSATQRAHRLLLQTVMEKHGFKPYPKEWWHFTLKNEPYPETYFNFTVE